ncbi:MAG TPA: ABC transporter ATP-binding protein [Anaerolineales bacterium]|jgi:peptide/nickel transport system ATP-binding protein|nr:ABC transporter ATP-binding protein [Anaerolineales bacterium]
MTEPTLSVRNLSVVYQARRGHVQAVRDISFDVQRGEALALIGESGSGKTTLGLGLMRLLPATARIVGGSIVYRRHQNGSSSASHETKVLELKGDSLRQFRWRECAMVFQSALNALNPVLRISEHFADTAKAHGYLSRYRQGTALRERSWKLLSMVRLDPERVWHSFPHELSGGMRQRVLIALALLLEPQLLILDEPTTALDILTQRNIMDVLKELRHQLGFSMLFISHDLALAAELADRVATVYAGKIIEIGDVRTIFRSPYHPYTIGLIKAVPTLTSDKSSLVSVPGSPPDLIQLPTGCKFHPRCPLADERSQREEPELLEVAPGHHVACWHWTHAREALKSYQAETKVS